MKKKKEKNNLLYHGPQKTLKTATNHPEKESKPKKLDTSKPLNKEQVEKHLSLEIDEDVFENAYEPESDPVPIVIFDSELDSIEEVKAVDLVFLLDTTGSMNCYLKGVKRVMRKIIWDIEKCLSQYIFDEVDVLKVGLVTYKDHGDENKYYLTKIKFNLTENIKEAVKVIMAITCQGGSDVPEAVLDGLQVAVKDMNWRKDSVKFIYHILDAPSHGPKYNINIKDNLEKCPNDIDVEELMEEIRNKDIKYSVIKLDDCVDAMLESFQQMVNVEVLAPKVFPDKTKIIPQE